MAQLHLTKVAVGCSGIEALRQRQAPRIHSGAVSIVTRFRPRQAEALVGGSLYWIIRHRILARQTILGFGEDGADGRTLIRLDSEIVSVFAAPRRAHQGWRYLAAQEAPADLAGDADGLARLPPALAAELAGLALI